MSWDLSHLGAKYPWLQVNAATLEEFRAPFDWSKRSASRDEVDNNTAQKPPGRRRHKPPHHGSSPSHATARQVLVINTRDHLTDAVGLLQRYDSPPPKPTKASVLLSQTSNLTIPLLLHDMKDHDASPLLTSPANSQSSTTRATKQSKFDVLPSTYTTTTSKHQLAKALMYPAPKLKPPMHKQKQQNSHHIRDVAPMQPYATVPASSMPTPAITSKHSSGHSKSAALLAKQSQDLERALTQAKADELALFKSLGDTIDAQRATIPLQFLFERNMSAYCIQKGVETILHVFSTLQVILTAHRKQQIHAATRQRVQAKAIALLNRVAGDCLMGNTKRALYRWHRTVKRMVADERDAAATAIQKHTKRRRDSRIVQRMREERVAMDAQNVARILQLLALEANGRKNLWTIREHAGKIRERRAYEARTREEAAVRIQSAYRGHRGRVMVQRLRQIVADAVAAAEAIKHAALLRLRNNSTLIQSIIRMFLVRLRLYNKRMQDAIRADNALTIQRAWRMKKGKKAMASRFTKRKMSMEEQAEREVFLARQKFLAEMEKRRQACAVIMQRRIRGYLARKHVHLMRETRRLDHAVRRVQAAWRKSKGRCVRISFVIRIISKIVRAQFLTFRILHCGRYALHLRFLAQRERLEWEREAAALRIQTQWRRHVAWKEAQKRRRDRNEAIAAAAREAERRRHLVTCATDISRVYRGYVIRQKIKADGLAATKIQRCVRRWRGRKLRKIMKNIRAERRKQEEIAAIVIQRYARGMMGRRRAACRANEVAADARRKHAAAAKLQSRWRGRHGRSAANLLRRAHAVVHVESLQSTQHSGKSALELAIHGFDVSTAAGIKAMEEAISAAERDIEESRDAAGRIQRLYRGRTGRQVAAVRLAEKKARDQLKYESARQIQRIVRGCRGRRRVVRIKGDLAKEALREVYRRERIALEDKKKWAEQLDMEQFKADTVTRKERERKLLIAQQEEEIARLDAQTSAYKVQALEAQKTLKAAQAAAWKPMNDGFGNVFYSNELTGDTTWDIPEALQPKLEYVDREEDWEELYNPHTGQLYKHNRVSGAVQMNQVDASTDDIPIPIAAAAIDKAIVAETPDKPVVEQQHHPIASQTYIQPSKEKTEQNASSVGVLCWRCKKTRAVKECVNCNPDQSLYCASCFTKEHKAVAKKTHDFKRLNLDGTHAVCTTVLHHEC
ncbi:hypothetical protein AaE_004265 [Aphanomyces astaci]|uniref:WW domain-containing protein n=1 Tax=Aphanomyces astaci TaxID=112090 RepID=A0A6A5AJP9_APHAT|nr:hypothetical protein AaE_004265 [Aphanomyces astaci]